MEVVGQKVVILTGIWVCDLSVRGYLLPETKREAFEMHLPDNDKYHRKCPAFLAVDALDDNK